MEELKQILDFVRRTNPGMTIEKLKKILNNDNVALSVLGIVSSECN